MSSVEMMRRLNDNKDYLMKNLIPSDVVPLLRTTKFTTDDANEVSSQISESVQVSKLIDILNEKKDEETYENFFRIIPNYIQDNLRNYTSRKRRLSNSDIGKLIASAQAPKLPNDSIPRNELVKDLIKIILDENDPDTPLIVHGEFGCGKKNLLLQAMRDEQIYNRFQNYQWLSINKRRSIEVKQELLLRIKGSRNHEDISHLNESVYDCDIQNYLVTNTVLLVLADINSSEIFKKFKYNAFYIVISTNNNIENSFEVKKFPVPPEYTNEECDEYMTNCNVDDRFHERLKMRSNKNPLMLSLLVNKVIMNKRWYDKLLSDELKDDHKIVIEYLNDIIIENANVYTLLELFTIFVKGEQFTEKFIKTIIWEDKYDYNVIEKLQEYNIIMDLNEKFSIRPIFYSTIHNEIKNKQDLVIKILEICSRYIDVNDIGKMYRFKNDLTVFFMSFYYLIELLNDKEKIMEYYTDFEFLTSKIFTCSINDLIDDYYQFQDNRNVKLNDFKNFLMRFSTPNQYNIKELYYRLLQDALYENPNSFVYKKALEITKSKSHDFYLWSEYRPSNLIWIYNHCDDIENISTKSGNILVSSHKNPHITLIYKEGHRQIMKTKITKPLKYCEFIEKDTFLVIDSHGNFKKFKSETISGPVLDESINMENNNSCCNTLNVPSGIQRRRVSTVELTDRINSSPYDHCLYCNNMIYKIKKHNHIDQSNSSNDSTDQLDPMIEISPVGLDGNNSIGNKIKIKVDKINIINSDDDVFFVILSNNEFHIFDEYSEKKDFQPISNCSGTINDFIIHKQDNKGGLESFVFYTAIDNVLYKNTDKFINAQKDNYIELVCSCSKWELFALATSGNRIEIYNSNKSLIWVLKEATSNYDLIQFTNHKDASDDDDDDMFLAVESESKNKLKSYKIHHNEEKVYRQCFFLASKFKALNSRDIFIGQMYDMGIYMFDIPNKCNKYHYKTSSKTLCYCFCDEFIFIGFEGDGLLMFNKQLEIQRKLLDESINEVHVIKIETYYIIAVEFSISQSFKFQVYKMTIENENIDIIFEISELSFIKFMNLSNQEIINVYWETATNERFLTLINNHIIKPVILDKICIKNDKCNKDFDFQYNSHHFAIVNMDKEISIQFVDSENSKLIPIKGKMKEKSSKYNWRACKFNNNDKKMSLLAVVSEKLNIFILRISDKSAVVIREIVYKFESNNLNICLNWSFCNDFIWIAFDKYIARFNINRKLMLTSKEFKAIHDDDYVLLKTYSGSCRKLFLTQHSIPCTIDKAGILYWFQINKDISTEIQQSDEE